jgi:hypothetical protein
VIAIIPAQAQISGCTDPLSKNYNPFATINDGSCRYAAVKIKPTCSVKLDPILKETSGLTQIDSLLWTSNDDTDTALYAIDKKGVIQNKIQLKNTTNTDWEDIAQDRDYFYIGDFGNNASGNRILKLIQLLFHIPIKRILTKASPTKPILTVKLLLSLETVFSCLPNNGKKKEPVYMSFQTFPATILHS